LTFLPVSRLVLRRNDSGSFIAALDLPESALWLAFERFVVEID